MEVIGLLGFSPCPDIIELIPSAIGMLEKGDRLSVKKCVSTRRTGSIVHIPGIE
jgi:hypothetical protein